MHLRDLKMQAAPDNEVLGLAESEQRILISADTDFGTLLASRSATGPSVILLRRVAGRRPEDQTRLLLANLERLREFLVRGAIVVIENHRIRLRMLPI